LPQSWWISVENGGKFNYADSSWYGENPMKEETISKENIALYHWERLARLHPTDVCDKTEALYNPTREGFLLPIYNRRYLILPKEKKVLRIEGNDQPVEEDLQPFFHLMVLFYLTEAKKIKPSHAWVSEKDLKGGPTFFQGPHRLQVKEVEDLYGKNTDAFLLAGKRLGGHEILYGDKGFALEVFPKVPLAYILWKGDEEFPPKIGILFDSTIQSHLPLDIIWCMVSETSRRLTEHSSSP
jgi:hypothetical protein